MDSFEERDLPTLSWAEARNADVTDSTLAQTVLINTAVSVLAGRQASWSEEAGEPLLVGESPCSNGRIFQVTDLHKTRFAVTVRHPESVAMEDMTRDYEKIRTLLAMIVHGANTDPTVGDRLADAWGVKLWSCDVCQAPFAHWAEARLHEEVLYGLGPDNSPRKD
ncbi:hypothetical protein [Sulfobacillus harzensis]|uniref:Uncharacterized protein n=1 Tax=Sulfobacillus harzensis TaxID=2729629 RepID=A0A7Y0L3H7_9FIRM|nr:hypothetical protein [Sulfobacillus harzensis]NMP22647.1 hypothetical protein [Sulfobacillus harzensis]